MAKRHGTVLVFKEGVTQEQIQHALTVFANSEDILDDCFIGTEYEGGAYEKVPFRIEEFDDDHGGPVWYVP